MSQHPNLAALDRHLAEARHPDVAAFLQYMIRIHPAGRLPARADFDPRAIPALLPGVVLAEVVRLADAAPRLRVTVAGETVRNASPVPMMGRFIDEIAAEITDGRVIVDVRQKTLDSGTCYYWYGPPRMRFRLDFANLEYVHCPLATDGATIDHIISFFHYEGA
ncbi:hypothetical protein [Ferrovibrio xuzhouensis]|uniref:PAS domain-containing protein n=1 Tax=Ferrovibrio xuzhouensis TaxID=1576914 RepID=A0ABV7VH61_9PROT